MGPPLGALPPMRMTASWSRSRQGSAEYKVAAEAPRRHGKLPSDPTGNHLDPPEPDAKSLAPYSPPSRPRRAASRRTSPPPPPTPPTPHPPPAPPTDHQKP